MKSDAIFLILACTGVLLGAARLSRPLWQSNTESPPPAAASAGQEAAELRERGKYLVMSSGCNDCHTPGFMQLGLKVPESEWLTGVPLGWQGPWGTSYASNLRRHLEAFPDAGVWISMIRARGGLPPMPWSSLHSMTDSDLRALHAYIRGLPAGGEVMPPALPPGKEPSTPYLVMNPVIPATALPAVRPKVSAAH